MAEQKTVITLICERAAEVDSVTNEACQLEGQPNVKVVKFPCSGMIQPNMIEKALKGGASGVVVCGCQIGDCYYREGNKMIKERILGSRPPGLKKFVDRRRILALWLSRKQTERFLSETKEFSSYVAELDGEEKPKVEAKKPAAKVDTKKKEPEKVEAKKSEDKKEESKKADEKKPEAKKSDDKKDAKSEDKKSQSKDEAKGEAKDKDDDSKDKKDKK